MARTTKQEPLFALADYFDEGSTRLQDVSLLASPTASQHIISDMAQALKQSASDAQAIARRLRRMHDTLNMKRAETYLVFDPASKGFRPATEEDIERVLMGWPPRGVSIWSLLNHWHVTDDGQFAPNEQA